MDESISMSVHNRTGIGLSPMDSQRMVEATQEVPPSSNGNIETLNAIESNYIREAEPVGSVPLPGTMKGAAQTIANKLTGKTPEVLIDKLGERLAFERTGTRLYDRFIAKCQNSGSVSPDSIDTLREFQREEAAHFKLVSQCLQSLGADPTAQTPGADVIGVASTGVLQVVSDPRTTVNQSLEAVLTAELVDNAGWELLAKLAGEMKLTDMEAQFKTALREEERHLQRIRQWLEQATLAEAGMAA